MSVAATRPHYGGTLRIALRMAPTSLDPAEFSASVNGETLSRLVFDTLVVLDDRGRAQPALATSWQPDPGNQRWHIFLRKDIAFQDGTPLSSDLVSASLRSANSNWKVFPASDTVVIETDSPDPSLPNELALNRNAIVKRAGSKVVGTGPYAIAQWDAGKKLSLVARDDYWNGRPFVDTIEIELGKNLRDQMISLDVGKADFIEIAPEQAHHAGMENRRVELSSPAELMALVFAHDAQSGDEIRLRQALAAAIDRGALSNVLFQCGAEPAVSLLPNWMTGYEFLFTRPTDPARALQLRGGIASRPWTLTYDSTDSLARVIAERIALNARDAGLTVQTTVSGNSDIRLVRVPLDSLDDRVALIKVAAAIGLPQPKVTGDSIEDLYGAETTLLNSQRVIPLLHVRNAVGIASAVRNYSANRLGVGQLPDVWLGAENP
jgi:ABC-type transport system substrate-binding protein